MLWLDITVFGTVWQTFIPTGFLWYHENWNDISQNIATFFYTDSPKDKTAAKLKSCCIFADISAK